LRRRTFHKTHDRHRSSRYDKAEVELVVLQQDQPRAFIVMLGIELKRGAGDKAHMLLPPSNETWICKIRQAFRPQPQTQIPRPRTKAPEIVARRPQEVPLRREGLGFEVITDRQRGP